MGTGDSIKSKCFSGNIGIRGATHCNGFISDKRPITDADTTPGSVPTISNFTSANSKPNAHTMISMGSQLKTTGKAQSALL